MCGVTGSFVSQDGLVLTNHHVAFTSLQRASATSSNLLAEGFLARTLNEEDKAPGYRALISDWQYYADLQRAI